MNDAQKDRIKESCEAAGVGAWEAQACQEMAEELRETITAEFTVVIACKGDTILFGAWAPDYGAVKEILKRSLELIDDPKAATAVDLTERDT